MELDVSTRWDCPNCDHTRVTNTATQHTVVHRCVGLGQLIAPLVRAGTRCRVVAVEREDYVGRERVQSNEAGRPIMSIVTIRDDGQDCRILAPTATGGGSSGVERK